MAKSITRCPKCHTAFRVTEAHLNSAKGAVRCGSCLNIFNAKDFLVSQSANNLSNEKTVKAAPQTVSTPTKETRAQQSTKPATATTSLKKQQKDQQTLATSAKPITKVASPNAKATSNSTSNSSHTSVTAKKKNQSLDDDDILISDDFELEDDTSSDEYNDFDENTIFTKSNTASSDFNLFERKTLPKDDDEETNDTDESWALDLLRDDKAVKLANDIPAKDTKFNKGPTGRFTAFQLLDNSDQKTTAPDDKEETQEHIHLTTAEKIRAESAHVEHIYLDTDDHFTDKNIDELPASDGDHDIDDSDYYTNPQYSSATNKYIDSIEPEPVEFSWKKHGGNIWYSNTFWMTLSLLAFGLSIGQLAYFKFDKLSRIEPYRQYYSISCGIIGCKLPALVDISKIRTVNLVIRSHPSVSGELLVDAVIQNDAPFDQVFPSLDLIFTDINNKPIAAKRFKPNEYLAGELAGRRSMPSRQPIHIALQIEDPGPAAINYQMTISQVKN